MRNPLVRFPTRDKIEFAYKYRAELKEIYEDKNINIFAAKRHPKKTLMEFIALRARIEIGYADTTYTGGIIYLLRKSFYSLIPIKP